MRLAYLRDFLDAEWKSNISIALTILHDVEEVEAANESKTGPQA